MNKNKLTIIIPVYNAEDYLSRCLDSILDQDMTSYEVILVDAAAIIFGFLILISFFVVMFTLLIKSEKYEKAKREQEKNNPVDNEEREFETVEINVKVIDQCCTTRMVGVKYPKSIEEYFIVFQIDSSCNIGSFFV